MKLLLSFRFLINPALQKKRDLLTPNHLTYMILDDFDVNAGRGVIDVVPTADDGRAAARCRRRRFSVRLEPLVLLDVRYLLKEIIVR